MESVKFQISAIGAELLPGKRPLWYLGDTTMFPQQPAVPNHGLGSLVVLLQPMWGPGALGFDPGAALVAKSPKHTLFTQIEPQNHIICQEVRTSGPPARAQVPQGPQG